MSLTSIEKEYIIQLLHEDKNIPEDFKYKLFPTLQEEYELSYAGKMRKEDVLAGEDGTLPVPLQIERVFNGDKFKAFDDGWKNMIVFGDNLQFLKTINENKDRIIKDKVKGKVKLIYIDPPFATEDEFKSQAGIKAYTDRKRGSQFVEYLRRRIILAKEILADDGSIFVHLDYKMGHYVKMVLDEVFGKNNLLNEIIWHYKTYIGNVKDYYPRKHDTIYWYYKKQKPKFTLEYDHHYEDTVDAQRWSRYIVNGNQIKGANYPRRDSRFTGYLNRFIKEHGRKPKDSDVIMTINGLVIDDVWHDIQAIDPKDKIERSGYPTQKPEELLARIIDNSTDPGDIVMDFFGGSGTTMAVAEKLGRKWITCDLGKLSYFTMQKRILDIAKSKMLSLHYSDQEQLYNKQAKSFVTCKLGIYDLGKTLSLEWDRYKDFVSQLFEYETKEYKLSGITFEGEKRGFPVKVFDYIKYDGSAVDEQYLQSLHNSLKKSKSSRVYIVAPATRVKFIADYEEIDNTRYYFMKVPYEMIEELHKVPFTKSRQPRSSTNINNIEEMKGFQFIYKPKVECDLILEKDFATLRVSKFLSDELNGEEHSNFETLSSIFINYDFEGDVFVMDDVRFWDQIESTRKSDSDTSIFREKDVIDHVTWKIPKKLLGKEVAFVFTDIYGNDSLIKLSVENNNGI